jgi:16S rRNA processing protein RimM
MTHNTRKKPAYLLLGKILRPHGIRGEVRMALMTDFPERLNDMETVFLSLDPQDTQPESWEIETVRFHQNYALIKFKNIPDRTQAELLREQHVMVDLANAVPLAEGEYYLFQLLDMTVQTEDGLVLGKVVDVMETGANDVYVLKSPQYGEVLFPAHSETLLDINVDTGIITVKLPAGLLPDTSAEDD